MSENENNSSVAPDSEKTVEGFYDHFSQAFVSAGDFKFEDAQFHLDRMKTLASHLTEPERPLATDFLTLAGEYIMGNQGLSIAKTSEDRQAALAHLSKAKNTLRNLRASKAFENNAGFMQMALGLDSQVLGVQTQLAQDRGDFDEVARLKAQIESGLDEMIKSTAPEDPVHSFLRGVKSMQEAMPKFAASIQAAGEMNLDLAQQYMRDASKSFATMKSCFTGGGADAVMAQVSSRFGNGFGSIAEALELYVHALRSAIIGDVSKTDVEALAEAERKALDGAMEITKATSAAPGVFGKVDMQPYAKMLAMLIRNLRALTERSLSPKEISRSASPRALIYFLGAFVVLLLALPMSGLVQKIDFTGVIFLLVISAIISLISAFGFESLRFVPWFDTLARFVPGVRKAEKSEAKA